jgi:hypothetical protein
MQKNETRPPIYRDQLITLGDLEIFKRELLEEIRNLLNARNSSAPKKWLRSAEVRKLLGISPATLQNLRVNGLLKYSKVGGTMFYEYDAIVRLMSENEGA